MTTNEQKEQNGQDGDLVQQIAEELAHVQSRIGPRFRRSQVRMRADRFLEGSISAVERKSSWQIAEEVGLYGPRGMQRLLGEADWDEEAVRDDLQANVIEHLGEDHGILVGDEPGFVKKGQISAGVARQYSGTAGRRENSQVGVFLLSASIPGSSALCARRMDG
jgi:SRSO17 transposase